MKLPTTAEDNQPTQFHSSCTLTLILTEIQLQAINVDNNKQKNYAGLGLGSVCILIGVLSYYKKSNIIKR